LQLVLSRSLTATQVELVEHALRQIIRISRPSWSEIPGHLQPHFARYMMRDIWTGVSDPVSLSEASLRIVRDAISRTGEFSEEDI